MRKTYFAVKLIILIILQIFYAGDTIVTPFLEKHEILNHIVRALIFLFSANLIFSLGRIITLRIYLKQREETKVQPNFMVGIDRRQARRRVRKCQSPPPFSSGFLQLIGNPDVGPLLFQLLAVARNQDAALRAGGGVDHCVGNFQAVFLSNLDGLVRDLGGQIQDFKSAEKAPDRILLDSAFGPKQNLDEGNDADLPGAVLGEFGPRGFDSIQVIDENIGIENGLHRPSHSSRSSF